MDGSASEMSGKTISGETISGETISGETISGETISGRTRSRPTRASDTAANDTLVMVTDLATELGITARTLRFYEDQGLIAPRRVGSSRVYSKRERARMIIILRGKRLGFSIKEIRDFLDLYDTDHKGVIQMRALIERIAQRRRQLEDKREAIAQALQGLADLEADARGILAKADARQGNARREKVRAQTATPL